MTPEITASSEELLRQVSSCRLNQVGLKNSPERTLTIIKMTEQQKSWVKLFQLHLNRYLFSTN